jgi:anti-sigma factor RsiW
MCDFSGRLIAWLDRELPADEAVDVERHVGACAECRSQLESYKDVTDAFGAFCDAAMTPTERRGLPRWAIVLSGTVAAAAALLLVLPPTSVQQTGVRTAGAQAPERPAAISSAAPIPKATAGAVARKPASASVRVVRRRRTVAPVQVQDAPWTQQELAIEIAIPVEAMFPPGAVPEGVSLFAEVGIAADGSAQRVRLRP